MIQAGIFVLLKAPPWLVGFAPRKDEGNATKKVGKVGNTGGLFL